MSMALLDRKCRTPAGFPRQFAGLTGKMVARQECYFSEKLSDCFVSGTIPLYWGCVRLGDYFDMGEQPVPGQQQLPPEPNA